MGKSCAFSLALRWFCSERMVVRREGAKGAPFTWFDIGGNYAGLNRGDGAVPGILMHKETTQTVA